MNTQLDLNYPLHGDNVKCSTCSQRVLTYKACGCPAKCSRCIQVAIMNQCVCALCGEHLIHEWHIVGVRDKSVAKCAASLVIVAIIDAIATTGGIIWSSELIESATNERDKTRYNGLLVGVLVCGVGIFIIMIMYLIMLSCERRSKGGKGCFGTISKKKMMQFVDGSSLVQV